MLARSALLIAALFLFTACSTEALPAAFQLELHCTPAEARVFLNGQTLGPCSQKTFEVLAGEHNLKVTAAGFAEHTRSWTARNETVQIVLRPVAEESPAPTPDPAPTDPAPAETPPPAPTSDAPAPESPAPESPAPESPSPGAPTETPQPTPDPTETDDPTEDPDDGAALDGDTLNERYVTFSCNFTEGELYVGERGPFACSSLAVPTYPFTLRAAAPGYQEAAFTVEAGLTSFTVDLEPTALERAQLSAECRALPVTQVVPGSLQTEVDRAVAAGGGCLVLSGIYRESVDTYYTSPSELVLESLDGAVISGSDVWTNFTCSGAVCTHAWPYDWGPSDVPWTYSNGDAVPIGELGLRRELVFAGGTKVTQVLSRGELRDNTFYVDEAGNTLYIDPPGNTLDKVEVAVREKLFRVGRLGSVTLRGLTFTHAASHINRGAVQLGTNARLVESHVSWNGAIGVTMSGENIALDKVTLLHNGSEAFQAYRASNLSVQESEWSYNNWRGHAGGFNSWSVGQKLLQIHGARFTNNKANSNHSAGLWFDWDSLDITVDGLEACDNERSGLFLEMMWHNVEVKNSLLCRNGRAGLEANGVWGLKLTDTRLTGNGEAALLVVHTNRRMKNHRTGETGGGLNGNWTVRGNTFSDDATLVKAHLWNRDARLQFYDSSQWDANRYYSGAPEPFEAYPRQSFSAWQASTLFDGESVLVPGLAGR